MWRLVSSSYVAKRVRVIFDIEIPVFDSRTIQWTAFESFAVMALFLIEALIFQQLACARINSVKNRRIPAVASVISSALLYIPAIK